MRKLHRNLCVLESDNERVLKEIVVSLENAGLLVRRVSPTFAVVDPKRIEEVLGILKDLGQLPKMI